MLSFDRLDHDLILASIRRRVTDGSILNLIQMFLTSGVLVDGNWQAGFVAAFVRSNCRYGRNLVVSTAACGSWDIRVNSWRCGCVRGEARSVTSLAGPFPMAG